MKIAIHISNDQDDLPRIEYLPDTIEIGRYASLMMGFDTTYVIEADDATINSNITTFVKQE